MRCKACNKKLLRYRIINKLKGDEEDLCHVCRDAIRDSFFTENAADQYCDKEFVGGNSLFSDKEIIEYTRDCHLTPPED